jgi:hypothetical protein
MPTGLRAHPLPGELNVSNKQLLLKNMYYFDIFRLRSLLHLPHISLFMLRFGAGTIKLDRLLSIGRL